MKHRLYLTVICVLILVIGYMVATQKEQPFGDVLASPTAQPSSKTADLPRTVLATSDGGGEFKTYTFNQFHGEKVEGGGFTFQYPSSWHNNGQYFSPRKIKYYDNLSVDAPVYFDLVDKELFGSSDIKYQITTDKRRSSDTTLKIGGVTFKRYDLIDYGSSGGESSGRVIIYLGPRLSFNGGDYYLVFHWEESPLTIALPGNDPEIFEFMVSSLKFITK